MARGNGAVGFFDRGFAGGRGVWAPCVRGVIQDLLFPVFRDHAVLRLRGRIVVHAVALGLRRSAGSAPVSAHDPLIYGGFRVSSIHSRRSGRTNGLGGGAKAAFLRSQGDSGFVIAPRGIAVCDLRSFWSWSARVACPSMSAHCLVQ